MYIWFYTGFVTRIGGRVPLVEQELLIIAQLLSLPPGFLVGFVLIDL
jgi:hypothetical protein